MTDNTKETIGQKTLIQQAVIPVCGICKFPLGKKSKGKRCYHCGAIFTNPEVLPIND